MVSNSPGCSVDQAGLRSQGSACLCLPSPEIKGMGLNAQRGRNSFKSMVFVLLELTDRSSCPVFRGYVLFKCNLYVIKEYFTCVTWFVFCFETGLLCVALVGVKGMHLYLCDGFVFTLCSLSSELSQGKLILALCSKDCSRGLLQALPSSS